MPTFEKPPLFGQLILDVVEEINICRERIGRKALELDGMLNRAATIHCRWMAENASTEHIGKDGKDHKQRVLEEGFRYGLVGENNLGDLRAQTGEQAVTAWRRSVPHHANIFTSGFTVIGACCLLSVDGDTKTPYWCAVFASKL